MNIVLGICKKSHILTSFMMIYSQADDMYHLTELLPGAYFSLIWQQTNCGTSAGVLSLFIWLLVFQHCLTAVSSVGRTDTSQALWLQEIYLSWVVHY